MSTNDETPDDKTPRSDKKEIELRRARREQGARERLGPINPKHLKCLYCDVTDPLILEKHHIAGRRYDNDTVIVCRNHHRLLSNFQKDHAAPIYENPHPLENIARRRRDPHEVDATGVIPFVEPEIAAAIDPCRPRVRPR